MNYQNKDYRFDLKDSEEDPLDSFIESYNRQTAEVQDRSHGRPFRKILLAGLLLVFGLFIVERISNNIFNPITAVVNTMTNGEPSEDLLNRMNALMVEMGYADLTTEDLIDLRDNGVTATYISNVRSLGYTELTLDEAVSLARADASSTFIAMMIELGYDLTVEEIIQLRRAGVTAFYTSRVHDLGYRDVTIDQLIRMQRIGLSTELIEQMQQENGADIPLEDIIRYRISNQ